MVLSKNRGKKQTTHKKLKNYDPKIEKQENTNKNKKHPQNDKNIPFCTPSPPNIDKHTHQRLTNPGNSNRKNRIKHEKADPPKSPKKQTEKTEKNMIKQTPRCRTNQTRKNYYPKIEKQDLTFATVKNRKPF